MTDRKRELVERDDACWGELQGLLALFSHEQIVLDGYYDGWSVKDLLAHIGCWYAETATIFEQMRMGTWDGQEPDTDALNEAWYLSWRDKGLDMVLGELNAGRWRTLEQWNLLTEVTPQADEWFRETSYEHYEDHLPRLREWVAELNGR